jgi:steroid delta-isomerase
MPELPDDFAPHPARDASLASMRAIEAGDKAAWLALFADDAVVEDPIGPSPFSPDGSGQRGRDAIEAFYDSVIGPNDV